MLPLFPGVTTGPARHDQDAEAVRLFVELLAIQPAFQPDRVQPQVFDVREIGVQLPGRPAQENIRRPCRSTDEDPAAVYPEEPTAFGCQLGGHFANSEAKPGRIARLVPDRKGEGSAVHVGLSHRIGPPHARMRELQLGEVPRLEIDRSRFTGRQRHGLTDADALELGMQNAIDCAAGGIAQVSGYGQCGSLIVGIESGCYEGIAHGHRATLGQKNLLPDAHILVRGRGIPVHPGNPQVVLSGRSDFHGDGIGLAGSQQLRDIEFVAAVGPRHFGIVGDHLPIDPDVGAVVDPQEMEPLGLGLLVRRQRKLRAVPPGATEWAPRRHILKGKNGFVRIVHARHRPHVRAVAWIGVGPVCH